MIILHRTEHHHIGRDWIDVKLSREIIGNNIAGREDWRVDEGSAFLFLQYNELRP
jgi:hypothetical protein